MNRKGRNFIKNDENKIEKLLKIIINILFIFFVLYFIFINFRSYIGKFKYTYFLDIGSNNERNGKISKLNPNNRMSEVKNNDNLTYRELLEYLVYADIFLQPNSQRINIKVKFRDNFPIDSEGFYIGGRDKPEWSYRYKPIYLPWLKMPENTQYIKEGIKKLYYINPDAKKFNTIQEFMENIPQGAVIATDLQLKPKSLIISDYKSGKLVINTPLRGSHTLYVYAKDNLEITVSKQDINWYDGEDILKIAIYDLNNNLIREESIKDDGVVDKSHKNTGEQACKIKIDNIQEGIYRIELTNNGDMIIKRIEVNQSKLVVAKKIFFAGNKIYGVDTIPSNIYTKINRDMKMGIFPLHREGLQKVRIGNITIDITEVQKRYEIDVKKSDKITEINVPNNDIEFSCDGYFSFTKDSYFEPYEYTVVNIKNYKNADYLLIEYEEPEKDGDWLIGQTEFDLKELYVKDNKLSIMLNARHLGDKKYSEYTIPVDWIKAEVYNYYEKK